MKVSRAAIGRALTVRGPGLMSLRTWARGLPLLYALYRCLPHTWRERISRRYVEHMASRVRFPALPPAPVPTSTASELVKEGNPAQGTQGVNLFAYFRGQFGLAEAARSYALSLIEAGYPVALNDIDIALPHGFDDATFASLLVDEAPHAIGIIFVNPDYLDAAIECIGRSKLDGRYTIACWFWELTRVPDEWLPAIDRVDEIMVASSFVEEAFRAVTRKPITRVPLPVPHHLDSGLTRSDFGLDSDDFIFLTSFDFHSWVARKNPIAAIEAFRLAFRDAPLSVKLLIKTSNGLRHPEEFSELLKFVQKDPRILIRDEIIDRQHLRSLQRCCDVYVSLHRAEGFGLGLAECMSLGKPVIATAWSGNCDFMTKENSCLVPFRLVPVGPGEYLHGENQLWAAPDIAVAAEQMRRLYLDRPFACEIGIRAAAEISHNLSTRNTANLLIGRLAQISAAITSHQAIPSLLSTGPSRGFP